MHLHGIAYEYGLHCEGEANNKKMCTQQSVTILLLIYVNKKTNSIMNEGEN
jgi:hypothetical protein